jgi:hypothetical protein
MSGIVTPVLHRGLFGDGVDLVGALDRLAGHGGPSGLALIGEYVAFQIRCRRHVVATALGLAKHLEALDLASVPAGQELFEWWRRTFTERVPIRLTGGRSAAVSIPRGVAAAWRIGAARMLQGLGETFTALSRTIGAASDPAAFVETVSVELNDGLVGLLLNRLSGRACPHAREITTTLADSRYPSRARLVKELDVQGVPWRDGLGRFFAAPRTTARLPGRGVEVVVWQAGTCPFADFGYAQATSDPSSPAYCPGLD